jgi:hypothetical protein
MMNKYALGALAIAAVSLGVGTAQSARMPGSSGHGWPRGAAGPCFEHSNGLMENTCLATVNPNVTTRLLVVPVPVSNSSNDQSHDFRARFRGNGFHATTCQGLVIGDTNVAIGSSLGSTTSTSLQSRVMGSVTVSPTSVVQVECQVAPSTTTSPIARGGVLRVDAVPQ